jgi:hypothetical protein
MGKLGRSIPERGLCDTDDNWLGPERAVPSQSVSVDDELDPVFSGLYDASGEPIYIVRRGIGFLKFRE